MPQLPLRTGKAPRHLFGRIVPLAREILVFPASVSSDAERGVGAKTLRALALTAELIYGVAASRKDRRAFRSPTVGRMERPIPSIGRRMTGPSK